MIRGQRAAPVFVILHGVGVEVAGTAVVEVFVFVEDIVGFVAVISVISGIGGIAGFIFVVRGFGVGVGVLRDGDVA